MPQSTEHGHIQEEAASIAAGRKRSADYNKQDPGLKRKPNNNIPIRRESLPQKLHTQLMEARTNLTLPIKLQPKRNENREGAAPGSNHKLWKGIE
jgi:hypothetical protein